MLGIDCFTTAGLKEVCIDARCLSIIQASDILRSFIYGIWGSVTYSQSSLTMVFSFPYHRLCR
jgi:hypothetical protein